MSVTARITPAQTWEAGGPSEISRNLSTIPTFHTYLYIIVSHIGKNTNCFVQCSQYIHCHRENVGHILYINKYLLN